MATIRKRQLKNGVVYDIQVKVKDLNLQKTVIKTTTWKPTEKLSPKQEALEVNLFAQKFETEIKQLYSGHLGEVIDYNITFSAYGQKWLERVHREFSPSYYEMSTRALKTANHYIGGYKMKEITPIILQDFFDTIDRLKKKTLTVKANSRLREVMNEKNIHYKDFRYKYKINSGSLSYALAGKTISRAYADSMARILGVSTEEIFDITETEEFYSAAYMFHIKKAVRCIFAMAKKQRLIEHNYASAEYISYGRKPQRNIQCMDDTDARKLFEVLSTYPDIRAKTAIMILLLTGMRRGELAGLEWKDIDWETRIVSINRVGVYCKELGIYTKEPKTAGSVRRLTIPALLMEQLVAYKKWYDNTAELWGDRWVHSDRLFVQECGKPIAPDTVHFLLNKLLKESGLRHITVHSLRHTNITLQIAAGVPLVTVAGRAGHSRTSTTTDIYSHFIQSSDKFAADALDNLFKKKE